MNWLRQWFGYFFILFFWGGCAASEQDAVDEEVLSAMLFDLQLIKEVVSIYPYYHRDSIKEVLFDKFYAIHGVDSLQVLSLFESLRENPELLKSLNDKALEHGDKLLHTE
jgi:hypothetical protein